MAKSKKALEIPVPENEPFKLNLFCGKQKADGYINIHPTETEVADYVFDFKKPFPITSDTVDEIVCANYLPFLDGLERLAFLDECWRILKPKARIILSAPARGTNASYANPYYKFPPVAEDFFYFANKEWREANGFGDYPIACDFDWGYGFNNDDEIKARNDDMQRLAVKFLRNAAHEIVITMTKK